MLEQEQAGFLDVITLPSADDAIAARDASRILPKQGRMSTQESARLA